MTILVDLWNGLVAQPWFIRATIGGVVGVVLFVIVPPLIGAKNVGMPKGGIGGSAQVGGDGLAVGGGGGQVRGQGASGQGGAGGSANVGGTGTAIGGPGGQVIGR